MDDNLIPCEGLAVKVFIDISDGSMTKEEALVLKERIEKGYINPNADMNNLCPHCKAAMEKGQVGGHCWRCGIKLN